MENKPVPLAILISGRGSNMGALMRAIDEGRLRAEIRVVVSNRADAAGLALARAAGIETLIIPHLGFATRQAYDAALVELLGARAVRWVCLAGFMRVLGETFCRAFPNAILNVHPSLLPSFPGVNAQRQAFVHGVKVTGATVHFVVPELDAGPIVLQRAVEIFDDDNEQSVAARILKVEHEIYPRALQLLLSSPWTIHGRRVVFGATSHSVL